MCAGTGSSMACSAAHRAPHIRHRRPHVAVALLGAAAGLALSLGRSAAFAKVVQPSPSRRRGFLGAVLAGACWSKGASPDAALAESMPKLERYVEKDPALPGFQFMRPVGWEIAQETTKQRFQSELGCILRVQDKSGEESIEIALQPVDESKQKVSDFGNPMDFANAFANSASKTLAPPNTGAPSPVPTVTPLSQDASPDLRKYLAQYRFEFKDREVADRPPIVFAQLVGVSKDVEGRTYLYSITSMAPESQYDKYKEFFANVMGSFSIPEPKATNATST